MSHAVTRIRPALRSDLGATHDLTPLHPSPRLDVIVAIAVGGRKREKKLETEVSCARLYLPVIRRRPHPVFYLACLILLTAPRTSTSTFDDSGIC